MSDSKAIVEAIIDCYISRGVNPSNILLQKTVFYLKFKNIPVGYKFEPKQYGPFSFELSDDIKEIFCSDMMYNRDVGSLFGVDDMRSVIEQYIDDVIYIVDANSFEDVESFGYILYCYMALEKVGIPCKKENVLKEYRCWTGSKIKYAQPEVIYDRIMERIGFKEEVNYEQSRAS